MADRFKFEDGDYDFPFYNKIPYIPKWGWLIIFLIFPFAFLLSVSDKIPVSIGGCILLVVPILYFLKWDYKALFRMPSRRDILLVLALFAGYLIYALIMSNVLDFFSIASSGTVEMESVDFMMMISAVFSLIGEEFFKFIPLMFFMRIVYKYSNNRKLSVIISSGLIMVMFASIHSYNLEMFIFALFIQGFGSIFELYGYIKTKNIIVSYLVHLLTDEFIFILFVLFG